MRTNLLTFLSYFSLICVCCCPWCCCYCCWIAILPYWTKLWRP